LLFSLVTSLTSFDQFKVNPEDIKPAEHIIFHLAETLAQRLWDALTERDIDLKGNQWKKPIRFFAFSQRCVHVRTRSWY
jgi:hypothetical protein